MLKIVSRPPFDDFSINLFFSLYARKKQYNLGDAVFLYMWTGPISFKTGVYINYQKVFDDGKLDDMTGYFRLSSNSLKIAGDKRFFNEKEEMFDDYLLVTDKQNLSEEQLLKLRNDFYELYDNYSAQTINTAETERIIDESISNADKVVLFVKDHFRTNISTSWVDPMPEFSRYFNNMCEFYPDKQFIIVTSLENLDKEIDNRNCTVINMGGDITNQISDYMQFTPVINKEPVKNFISLNRGSRYHRLYLVASLFARKLDEYGTVSMLSIPEHCTQLTDIINYEYKNDRDYEYTNKGLERYLSLCNTLNEDTYDIYPAKANDNLTNFTVALQHKYVNSYVEFVSETSYNEKSFNITEKTLHFIYGCNYPIIISSPGTVKFLRSMGIDMFDDVIDHSYDDIEDPAERIKQAIDRNISVLTVDLGTLHKRWESDKYRMEQNISFVQNNLASFYRDRFWKQINELKD
jgi:hypothetical protein